MSDYIHMDSKRSRADKRASGQAMFVYLSVCHKGRKSRREELRVNQSSVLSAWVGNRPVQSNRPEWVGWWANE